MWMSLSLHLLHRQLGSAPAPSSLVVFGWVGAFSIKALRQPFQLLLLPTSINWLRYQCTLAWPTNLLPSRRQPHTFAYGLGGVEWPPVSTPVLQVKRLQPIWPQTSMVYDSLLFQQAWHSHSILYIPGPLNTALILNVYYFRVHPNNHPLYFFVECSRLGGTLVKKLNYAKNNWRATCLMVFLNAPYQAAASSHQR